MSMVSIWNAEVFENATLDRCVTEDADALWSWNSILRADIPLGVTLSFPSTCDGQSYLPKSKLNKCTIKCSMGLSCSIVFFSDVDDCSSIACNGHRCVDQINGYLCLCQGNYSGKSCEIPPNHCEQSVCQNNAQCIEGIASYSCQCTAGYNGDYCEDSIGALHSAKHL